MTIITRSDVNDERFKVNVNVNCMNECATDNYKLGNILEIRKSSVQYKDVSSTESLF